MKTKKQIDRLFKEQFKNLETAPPSSVWENIDAALEKRKNKKRVVPLWYKLAGVAASLFIILSVGSLFFNSSEDSQITSEDSIENVESKFSDPNSNSLKPSEKSSDALVENNHTTQKNSNSNNLNTGSKTNKLNSQISETTSSNESELVKDSKNNSVSNSSKSDENEAFTDIAEVSKSKIEEKETDKDYISNTTFVETTIANTDVTEEDTSEENKKSLIEYIAEKNEEALAVENSEIENKWEVSPNFAPVYYNTLGDGSSIDPQFSNNSKSGDINYSYGVKVSYAINDKLSVRTGFNKVDLSYSTNNIEFAVASSFEDGLQAVNYKNKDIIVAVGPRGSLTPPPAGTPTMTEDGIQIVPRNGITSGSMKQELDYFEIPLELKYNLTNNRLGVNLIGGLSTLLLNNNQVSVLSNGFQSEIGSANNLNDLSFSTNIGLGLDYKLSNSFVFNLEPMFKYQLNTYSDNAIDFKPYYLGVYSGFSYKF